MKSIYVVEHDGMNERSFILNIETIGIKDDLESIKKAAIEACNEYIHTDEGKKVYTGNCDCFNWADLEAYVPQDICKKHGFTFTSSSVSDYTVEWDEQLVTE